MSAKVLKNPPIPRVLATIERFTREFMKENELGSSLDILGELIHASPGSIVNLEWSLPPGMSKHLVKDERVDKKQRFVSDRIDWEHLDANGGYDPVIKWAGYISEQVPFPIKIGEYTYHASRLVYTDTPFAKEFGSSGTKPEVIIFLDAKHVYSVESKCIIPWSAEHNQVILAGAKKKQRTSTSGLSVQVEVEKSSWCAIC